MKSRPNLPSWPAKPTQRGANNRFMCRCGCGVEVPAGRRTWASPDCIERVKLLCDWSVVRKHIYELGKGICVTCGCHPESYRATVREAFASGDYEPLKQAKQNRWPRISRVWYEIDHEIPVCEGGDTLGRRNLRVQCYPCHVIRTKAQNQARRLMKCEAKRAACPTQQPVIAMVA